MKLLAISTSGPIPSAALIADGRVRLVQSHEGLTHSQTIMPLIDELLDAQGLSPADLDLFAADTGPGSFTGVRIGVCAANAMAAALHKPVMGISSLAALAHGKPGQVCAILDARNGNAYAALFGHMAMPPTAVCAEEFLEGVPAGTLFTGDIPTFEAFIRAKVKAPVFAQDNALLADAVGRLALAQYEAQGAPLDEIRPLYLRPSQAERLFEAKNYDS